MRIKGYKFVSVSIAAGLAMSAFSIWPQTSFDAATPPVHESALEVNGHVVARVPYVVLNHTAYAPIYYIQRLINQLLHLQPSNVLWDGSTQTWTLTGVPDVLSWPALVTGGKASILINGVLIGRHIPTTVQLNPLSHGKTTFMPVGILQRLLNGLLGLAAKDDVWNASPTFATWLLQVPPPVTKEQAVKAFVMALDVPEDTVGQYDFTDLPSTDPDWPYIITALNRGYVNSDTMNEFGSADMASKAMLDSMYWNFVEIVRADGAPGGQPSAWADIIGLNHGLSAGTLLPMQLTQFLSNVLAEQRGYRIQQQEYHLLLPPRDEYETYSTQYPDSHLESSSFQIVMTNFYRALDSTTIRLDKRNTMVVTLPSITRTYQYQALLDQRTPLQVSVDGGKTWAETLMFKTNVGRDYSGPILIKASTNIPFTLIIRNTPDLLQGTEISETVRLNWVNGILQVARQS